MKYHINETKDGLSISVDLLKEQKEQLIDAFNQCQQGQCSCPSDEYNKLESLDIDTVDNHIELDLKVKEGQKIDKSEIDKCLEFTTKQLEQ